MSCVTCHVSPVTCQKYIFFYVKKKWTKWWSLLVEGLLSMGPIPRLVFLGNKFPIYIYANHTCIICFEICTDIFSFFLMLTKIHVFCFKEFSTFTLTKKGRLPNLCQLLADPGKARGCSTKRFVNNQLIN